MRLSALLISVMPCNLAIPSIATAKISAEINASNKVKPP